jgi:hypothetical protein
LKLPNRTVEEVREKDPDGRIVVHHRTVDTLRKMLEKGTITPEMYDAGQVFQASFILANLDNLRALPLVRQLGAGGPADFTDRQLLARRRVLRSIEKLGAASSPIKSHRRSLT